MTKRKNKELIWVSRYEIVRDKLMLGLNGVPMSTFGAVKKYMERLPSYTAKLNSKGRLTQFVTTLDIDEWNDQVRDEAKKFKRKTYVETDSRP